jgi:hypothetical protein
MVVPQLLLNYEQRPPRSRYRGRRYATWCTKAEDRS